MLFNIVDAKAGWPMIELELLDCPTRHEPVEVRCTEVASCVHGGGEWVEIGGIAEDRLTFLSEKEQKSHGGCVMVQYHTSVRCDWCPYFYFYFGLVYILRDLPSVPCVLPLVGCPCTGTHQEKRSGGVPSFVFYTRNRVSILDDL